MRASLFKIILVVIVVFIAYLLFGPVVCEVAFKGGQKRIATLARLHNLKVVMPHITEMAARNEILFPEDAEELMAILQQELDPSDLMDVSSSPTTLTDAWDNELRLDGDLDEYFIRSAGPDKVFDTDDDIYLGGNLDGEYIIDGSRQRRLTAKALSRRISVLPFEEPTGYYRIFLPGRYTVIPKYEGHRSIIEFFYATNNYVRITADPIGGGWNAESEMADRIEQLQWDEEFSDFDLLSSNLAFFREFEGYEIHLERDEILAREFGFFGNNYLAVSVVIVASGQERLQIMDILTEEVKVNLTIHQ
ncbi:MAG: hypothetical protein GTO17_00470 [Candidatus Aminicenantes bacterium]|nr:hypothetical protein [Candidatus Aminicenantes bacterium]